jgi:hypothetical protein
MTTKTLFKLGAILLALIFIVAGNAFATKYYVNVQTGLDGNNGLSATTGGPGVGPKQTISNAIAAASSGDTIVVAWANGNLYNENVVVGNGAATTPGSKVLTFLTDGLGTPQVVSWTINNGLASPNDFTTFGGPFQINTNFTMTKGRVVGGSNLTVGTSGNTGVVTRTDGSVDSQLNFTGKVDFVYSNSAAVTAGFELPPAANTTNFNKLTTGLQDVTLNESKTMNGVLANSGKLKLGGGMLTIVGTTTHTVGADITGGTLAFTLTGAVTVNGNFVLPNISATKTTTGISLLTINTSEAVTGLGDVTASGNASITIANSPLLNSITNSGKGVVTVSVGGAVTADVVLNSTGLGATNEGQIVFSGAMTIGGKVTNSATIALSVATACSNAGLISFADFNQTVTGVVTNSVTLSASGTAAAVALANNGVISFATAAGTVTLTGGVVVSSSSTYGGSATITGFTGNGSVVFAVTTGVVRAAGGFSNSSSWPTTLAGTYTTNGNILFTARTTGVIGDGTIRTGAVVNTSAAKKATTNGDINFGAGTGSGTVVGFLGSSVKTSGADGGAIVFGNQDFSINGDMTNERTVTGTFIQVGTATQAGLDVSIGGKLTNSGAANIVFTGIDNGNLSITGQLVSSGTGSITTPSAGTTAYAATWSIGSVNITSGTVDFKGVVAAASTTNILITGNASFIGGTFDLSTTVGRALQLGGLSYTFSSTTSRTDFTSASSNVTLLIQPSSIQAAQTVTGALTTTIWWGPVNVNNTTGLQPSVTFTGGNFRVLNDVTFTAGQVGLNGMTLFIGGQLAPYVNTTGNFTNAAGYATDATGFVSMNSNVAAAVSGAGTFGNFEQDMGANALTYGTAGMTFTGSFYMTSGTTFTANNIIFSNTTPPPTIVVNAGVFSQAPNFAGGSDVNVTYIGLDKTVGNELPPVAANKLNNLTIATTNGTNVAGQGVVNVNVATTVKGAVIVNSGQALLLNGADLTMKGSTITLNGDIVNVAAGDLLILAATTGTTITGPGVLPDIQVNAASVGNVINGSVGLCTGLLGGDNLRGGAGGAADLNPGATGAITYAGGTASSLTVTFGTANATTGTHFLSVTTAAGGTFTLGGNLLQGGNLAHVAGTVDVATFTYTHIGAAPTFTKGAVTTGTTGKLLFKRTVTVVGVDVTLTALVGDVTIAAPVEISMASNTAGNDIFKLDDTAPGHFIFAGSFTLTKGTVQLGIGATGRNLTLTGSTFTVASGASINTVGIGVLRLNATTPPLTASFGGTGVITLGNVRVSNDVVLAGTATGITVSGTFMHDGGLLDFSSRTLTVATTGTFTRSAGTYAATTGYLVIATATFTQGTGFSIPNLRITATTAALGTASAATVTKAFDLAVGAGNTFMHLVTSVAQLNIADGATVYYTSGALDVAPVYANKITLVAQNAASSTIDATVWPDVAALVTTLEVKAGAFTATLPGSRTVNTVLKLTSGTLNVPTGKVLTLVDNLTVNANGAAVTLTGTGSVAYGNNISVVYAGTTPVGPELPPTVKDLTFTRTTNVANFATLVGKPVTVNGTLTIRNDVTTVVGATPALTGTITTLGNVVIQLEVDVTFVLATTPITTFPAAMIFGGSSDQTITVPAAGITIGAVNIQMAASTNKVTLSGGNLSSNSVTFTRGLFYTGANNALVLAGNALNSSVTGYLRNVATGDKSHVVGNVIVPLKIGQVLAFGRNEFPVGDATYFRPAAVTFVNPALPVGIALGISATIKYDPTRPTGIVGLPIANGVAQGTDIARYPDFSWFIKTTGSVGQQQFNLELSADGYTDFDDVANVRLIRRSGTLTDVGNTWSLQGAQYDNYVISGVPTVVNVNSTGGLIPGGAVYTYGLKSTMVVANPIADIKLTDAAKTFTRNLVNPALFTGAKGTISYTVTIDNPAVATVAIASNVLTVTLKVSGTTFITVTGTDAFDGSRISQKVNVQCVSAVEVVGDIIPTDFSLAQNYPNPFNPSTTIRFGLPKEAPVTLEIYNLLGMKVRTLISGDRMSAALYNIRWDGRDDAGVSSPSGMYIYRIVADKFVSSKKMALVK